MQQLAFPFLEWQVAVPLEPQPVYRTALFGSGKDWEWSNGRGCSSVATYPIKSYEEEGTYFHACPFKVGDRAAGGIIQSIRLIQTPSERWFWILSLGDDEPEDLVYAWRDLGIGRHPAERPIEWLEWWQGYEERFEVRARNSILHHTKTPSEYPYLTLEYNLEGEVQGLILEGEWGAFWPPPDHVQELIPSEPLKIVNQWYESEMV